MVKGSLAEEREPRKVQVELVESEDGLTIRLRDEGGVFSRFLWSSRTEKMPERTAVVMRKMEVSVETEAEVETDPEAECRKRRHQQRLNWSLRAHA